MLITDGRPSPSAYDCLVVGSGPAGLTTATTLADRGRRVLMFESGGEGAVQTDVSGAVGYGHYSGDYWNGHWVRALGGTSAVWAGLCTTLRDIDFDNPNVGVRWPIRRADLTPYYSRAAVLLDHDPALVDFERPVLADFSYRPFPIAGPTRFAEKYINRLRQPPGVDVALGCSVAGLAANPSRTLVESVDVFHHDSRLRRTLPLRPGQPLVMAAGGVGNAQLLLQPSPDSDVPVGNESGLAGRFLMEHPHFFSAGEVVMDEPLDEYWPAGNTGQGFHAVMPTDDLVRREGLYACNLQCASKDGDHEMATWMTRSVGRPFFHYDMTARAEMRPSEQNRVFLTAEREPSGLLRPAARCVLDARDFQNVEDTLRLLGTSLLDSGKGRVRVNNDRIYRQVQGGGHTMGTTRMGTSRLNSVVDGDCRVHGYANLFVAGSSVFPTGGYANPTLTIVALGLRLAETLDRIMERP